MWKVLQDFWAGIVAPRIYSLRGQSEDIWFLVLSGVTTALAHYVIVLVLLQIISKRKDPFFIAAILLLAIYIGYRGTTFVLGLWTIWHPQLELGDGVRVCSMVLAVGTALALVLLMPVIRRLPSEENLERKAAERRHEQEIAFEKEQRFRAFIEGVQDSAMYIINPQGVVQSWNLGARRIKGYDAEEIVGRHFSCFYLPEDIAQHQPERSIRIANESGRFEGEGWRVRKDGGRFWARVTVAPLRNSSGELVGFSKITRDLTELRTAEAKYQTLLETAPDAIVIVNGEGRITFANRRAEDLFGYRPEELDGKEMEILVPMELRTLHKSHRGDFFQSPRMREMGAGMDLMAVRKDGTRFPVEISLSPLKEADGISVTAAVRDVTESRLAARQLAQKVEELHHSNAELEQFAYIASHDLQEPLRMVASYTQLLANRYKGRLDADADEFIGYAVDGTRRMKRLIEDLLIYSRAGKGALPASTVDSAQIFQMVLKNLRPGIQESGARITSDTLPAILASEPQLVQLFQNLIGNAIKFRGDRTPNIHVSAAERDSEWIFSVADNGIGIDPKHFDRIFVLFKRLHGNHEYEGTGIGLAICKRVLHQLGGRIWVESEPGRGSTFYFSLPVR